MAHNITAPGSITTSTPLEKRKESKNTHTLFKKLHLTNSEYMNPAFGTLCIKLIFGVWFFETRLSSLDPCVAKQDTWTFLEACHLHPHSNAWNSSLCASPRYNQLSIPCYFQGEYLPHAETSFILF